jgi:hypothetical protein
MPRRFCDSEVAEFFNAHLAHRLTALLCVGKRSEQSDYWQGRGDVYCASIEGSFIRFRVFVEFLGLESYRIPSGEHDLRRRSFKKRRDTDVMLDNFGLALAEPSDFDPHRALVGRVHDGVSFASTRRSKRLCNFIQISSVSMNAPNHAMQPTAGPRWPAYGLASHYENTFIASPARSRQRWLILFKSSRLSPLRIRKRCAIPERECQRHALQGRWLLSRYR